MLRFDKEIEKTVEKKSFEKNFLRILLLYFRVRVCAKSFFQPIFLHLFCNFELEFELVLDMNQLNFNKIFKIRENKKQHRVWKKLIGTA